MNKKLQKTIYAVIAFFLYLLSYGIIIAVYRASDFTYAAIVSFLLFLFLFIPFCIIFGYKGYNDFKSVWIPVYLNGISILSFVLVLTLATCIKDSSFLYTQLDFLIDFTLLFSGTVITMYSAKLKKYKLYIANKRKEKKQ